MEHFEANEIKPLFSLLPNKEYRIRKPRKDLEKIILRERLAEVLGRNKRGLFFTTQIWTTDMLRDAIEACSHYTDIKARNWHFNQYKESTKIK